MHIVRGQDAIREAISEWDSVFEKYLEAQQLVPDDLNNIVPVEFQTQE